MIEQRASADGPGTASMEDRKPVSRFQGVQALRFLASFLVLITHSTFYVNGRLDGDFPIWKPGSSGVNIFFVISGFVIVIAAQRLIDDAAGWRRFAIRRIIRIVPVYWLATSIELIVLLVAPLLVLHSEFDLPHIVASYLFIPTYNADGRLEPLVGVGWTLLFEMFFYVVFTIALWRRANVFIFVGTVLSLCMLGSFFKQPDWPPFILFYLNPIAIEFFIGMMIARWSINYRSMPMVGLFAFVIGLAVLLLRPLDHLDLGITAVRSIPAAMIVYGVVQMEPLIGERIPHRIVFLGAASYALYLFHPMIAPAVPAALAYFDLSIPIGVQALLGVLGGMTAAILAASFIYAFLERPLTRWLGVLVDKLCFPTVTEQNR